MISEFLSPRLYRLFRRKPKVHNAKVTDRYGVGWYKASCNCGWKAKFGLYGEIHNGQYLHPSDRQVAAMGFDFASTSEGCTSQHTARAACERHMAEFNGPTELMDIGHLERTYGIE